MNERIAVIDGIRTPFCKAGGVFKDMDADDLGAYAVRELMARSGISGDQVDELIFGNVLQPPHATNIARVLAIKAGLPENMPAYTVNRNCASGLESITDGVNRIRLKQAEIIIAGGVESMSNFPILFSKKMRDFLNTLQKAKTWQQKLQAVLSFRFRLLKPEIPEIADPLCGLSMGQTAEVLSRDFRVARAEQDAFALQSQERAYRATQSGRFAEEIVPIPVPPAYQAYQLVDDGVRSNQTMEALAKLRAAFDPLTGSVTAGNSSQVTDGAAVVLLMSESKAKSLGLKPLGYIRDFAYAALDPRRMGLGPVFSTTKLIDKNGMKLSDFDLIEINEAFAAQVLACGKAFASAEFAKKFLNRAAAVGELDPEKLNVNGGAISLGHPLGASGTRLVFTLLKELNKRKKNLGLATMCIGGGQGGAAILEVQ